MDKKYAEVINLDGPIGVVFDKIGSLVEIISVDGESVQFTYDGVTKFYGRSWNFELIEPLTDD